VNDLLPVVFEDELLFVEVVLDEMLPNDEIVVKALIDEVSVVTRVEETVVDEEIVVDKVDVLSVRIFERVVVVVVILDEV
jgi:hypothetical protein